MFEHTRNKSLRSTDGPEELVPYENLGPDPLARLDMSDINGLSGNLPSRPIGSGQCTFFKARTNAPRMAFPDVSTDTVSTNTPTKDINAENSIRTRRLDSNFSLRLRNQQPEPLTISTGGLDFLPRASVLSDGIHSWSSDNVPPTPSTLSPWISIGKENNVPHSARTIRKKKECFIDYAADPFAKLDDLTPGSEQSRSPLGITQEPQSHFSDSEDDDKPKHDHKHDHKDDSREDNKDDNKLAKWFSSIGRGRRPRPSLAEQQQTELKHRRRKLTGILRGTTKDNITALGTTDGPRPRANTALIDASPSAVIVNGRPNTMPTTELELASMAVGRAM